MEKKKFTFSTAVSQGVPVGAYAAKFDSIEDVPPNEELGYGAGHAFIFEITRGEFVGKKTRRIVNGSRPTPKNALGKMLAGLKGSALGDGEGIDPNDFIGQPYTIMVTKPKPDGGTRVETVSAPMA